MDKCIFFSKKSKLSWMPMIEAAQRLYFYCGIALNNFDTLI